MARKMISNSRQGLDEETIVKITGRDSVELHPGGSVRCWQVTMISKSSMAQCRRRRQYQADTLKDVLGLILSNPEAAQLLQYDPRRLMDEILSLQ